MRFILLSTWWQIKNKQRKEEVLRTILDNYKSSFFDEIHLMFDLKYCSDTNDFKETKIKLVPMDEPITYKKYIDYANENFKGDIVVISNTDIAFDKTILLCKNVDYLYKDGFYEKMLCITRHHVINITKLQNPGSQDVWVFKSPIKQFENDICVGVMGCDSYLAQKAIEAGIVAINPSLSVDIWHKHRYFDFTKKDDSPKNTYWSYKDYKSTEIPYSKLENQ